MKNLLHFFWANYHKREGDERRYQNSNTEIQKWAEKLLEKNFTVHSTSFINQGRVTISAQDILLGGLTWDANPDAAGKLGRSQRNWVSDNKLAAGDPGHPNTYILTPWVPVFPPEWTDHMPLVDSQLAAARVIFGICGPIWHEQTLALDDESIQSKVKSKVVRLNMCVNYDAFKINKSTFNAVGQRKLIHVSNLGSYKGFDLLLDSTKGVTIPSIGSRQLAGIPHGKTSINAYGNQYVINHLGPVDNGNDRQILELVTEHDFYIHTASMDAQATTILEFAARGLIPLVTPASGFDSEDAIYLTPYASRNKDIIAGALKMPEDEMVYRSARIREKIKRDHSWEKFFDTIAETINRTREN